MGLAFGLPVFSRRGGALDNITDKGTNGKSRQVWEADEFLTITVASGTVTGLVGKAFVHYLPVD